MAVGTLISFIAALSIFFSVTEFVENTQEIDVACTEKCYGENVCKTICAMQGSLGGAATIIFIFLFVLAILATYFLLTRNQGEESL